MNDNHARARASMLDDGRADPCRGSGSSRYNPLYREEDDLPMRMNEVKRADQN